MFKDKLFISSTLPYINSPDNPKSPGHVGHLFEFILTDVIARYYRAKLGDSNVFFNTGTDEHGQKIFDRAIELKMSPQNYCDIMADRWKNFCKDFRISYNNFYRTTDPFHKILAVAYFAEMRKNNDVYKKQYSELYCQGCESFKTHKDLVNNACPDHPSLILETISEENFFFKLTKYAKSCVPNDILVDDTLRTELNNLIENSQDISVSRSKEKVSWAIPINDSDQTIYLWCEALGNYYFAAGYIPDRPPSKEFLDWWSNSMIVCGKDNLRFQALILPALLASAYLPSPTKVLVHGTILDENGNKMSKTEGNVIDPIEQLEKYGINAVRYYFIAGLNTFSNSKYSEKDLVAKYNAHLADGYGNLMARVLHLIDIKNIQVNESLTTNKDQINQGMDQVVDAFESGNLHEAYEYVSAIVNLMNVYISSEKPYADSCKNPEEVLNNAYYVLDKISLFYKIALPDAADAIDTALREKKKVILFKKIEVQEVTI